MFKGDKTKPESPDRLNRLVSGTKITGDISANSSLRIDGEVLGNIECNGKLVLGQEGQVNGNIVATEVEIDGKVEGNINAEILLVLHETAVVVGDIFTGRIVIEDGAQIDGNIKTGDQSKKLKKGIGRTNGKKIETSEVVY
ncbi:bactofilin family protein [Brumimicrobium aurantiacum]|uniref:Polymer-forming cytoskeletal protein n=1 Tax=Brumimicrobium aurantiacum TaxID=1737063 RepID=A0A3E1EXY2_9FLAO|nr:polymer-forming cytoskeletal protein [Brumimicrobium aurantiacum]RFC54398.1 polymer-forming cytoskeletal protein [Brumimicrobium aurantiacum]